MTCDSYKKYLAGDCFTCGVDNHYCIKFGYGSRESYQGLYASRDLTSSEALSSYMLTVGRKPYISACLFDLKYSFQTKHYLFVSSKETNTR